MRNRKFSFQVNQPAVYQFLACARERGSLGGIWLLRAMLWTMVLHKSLVAATPAQISSSRRVLQQFTHTSSSTPRMSGQLQLLAPFSTIHPPPEGDYRTVETISDVLEAVEVVERPTEEGQSPMAFVQVSDSVQALETAITPTVIEGGSLVFDCQGALLYPNFDAPPVPSSGAAQNDTEVDLYHCILYKLPGVHPNAKKIRFNDCRVIFPCGVNAFDAEAAGFRESQGLELVPESNTLTRGQILHLKDNEWNLNNGDIRHMRNVSVQCADQADLMRELAILQASSGPSYAFSWVIVGLITAAGIGAICCLLAALCDMRCRPSLAAAKAWLTTCGHTKIPVRIISSPPSPGASTAACVTPEVNPKGVMAAHRYHSHSKRYNAAAVSYDSSVPGDIARSPGGAVSLGTSAFHNEAFESDSPAVDSLDAAHYNTPLQSGPQRSSHMLEPSQMQGTNSSIHGSAFSRPPSRPGSLDGDASLDSLPLAWPPLAMKQVLAATKKPPKPPLNLQTTNRELGSPSASDVLSQTGSGTLPATRNALVSSSSPPAPAGSAFHYASQDTGSSAVGGNPQVPLISPPSSIPSAPRNLIAHPLDSSAHRNSNSTDCNWAHSTTGSANLATTPTRERPPAATGIFQKDSSSHARSFKGLKGLMPPASRSHRDASPHRGDASPNHEPAILGLPPSRQLSGPRSQEVGLLSTTSEMPKDHLLRYEWLSGYGPNICRASWKDIPAMIQELLVVVPCAPGTAVARAAAAVASQGRGGGVGASEGVPHSSDSAVVARPSCPTRASSHGRLPSLLGRTNSNLLVDLTNDSSLAGNTLTEGDMTVTSISSQHGPWAEVQVATKVVCKGARLATRVAHENIVNTFTFSVQHKDAQPGSAQQAFSSNKGGTPRNSDDGAPDVLHFTIHLVQRASQLQQVQELCVGGTLANLMDSGTLATEHGGIHARRIITILSHIAAGLHHLHANGLTHGDLDPSHVLLQVVGEEHEAFRSASGMQGKWLPSPVEACALLDTAQTVVKLGNFGWAVHEPCSYTPTSPSESVAYWAPERHNGVQNAATHIYSFGCLMWSIWVTQEAQMEPGCQPHPQLGNFPASTPLSYVMLATACLSYKPKDRPCAAGIVQDLNSLQRELKRHYTDLCGASQSIDRLAFRYDRANLLDPTSTLPLHSTMTSEQPYHMGSR